ncbi:MAG: insulinase family protein [Candidatus Pacebacteria bacterium]|nr:insulinase family protein [Candidatus Paceibacterota bacterium]MBP9780688.1 insulinase family protein [Candidatus Paceibacterota bacterium]
MKIQKKTLPNGLRVLFVSLPESPTVTVQILVRTGSRDEKEREHGISHFLEHMCFKGTKVRPSALHISKELEGLGAQSNAFTSYEYTGYYAKSQASHALLLVDIISDIYLNSTFPESEIQKEKGVVIEEINMYKDRPDHEVHEDWRRIFFEQGPLSRPIIGTKESVTSFSRKDLLLYQKKHYIPKNTVVVVSGTFDENKIYKEIKSRFENIDSKTPAKRVRPKISSSTIRNFVKEKKTDQAHLVIGVPAYDSFKPEKYALAVLSTILGGGMSSRLFQLLREEMGVAYYVYAHSSYLTDHGYFEIGAGVDKNRVQEVLEVIKKEIASVVENGVTDEELHRAKEYMIGSMYLDLESSDAFGAYYGMQEVLGRPIESPKEKEKLLRKVSLSDVSRVAKKILSQPLTTALIGDFPKDFLKK